MPDTLNSFAVGGAWTNLNTLTAIPVGTAMILQVVGGSQDMINIAISALEPAAGFSGPHLKAIDTFYEVAAGETSPVWVQYKKSGVADVGAKTTKLQVQ